MNSEAGEQFMGEFLQHAGVYDPQKAREYYLRTRKLKGRKPGAGDDPTGRPTAGAVTTSGSNKTTQHAKEAAARVAAIKVRLDRLKEVLAQLVEQAKGRSGVESKSDDPKKKESKTPDKPKSAAQKKKDAAAAKDRYQKEKKTSPDREAAALNKEIAEVQAKIAKVRAQIAESIQRARQSQSKPAPRPATTPGNRPPAAKPNR